MHGIILKTIREFVVDTHDEETWLEIQREADVQERVYVPVAVYPDGDVYELVRTAGELTDTDPRTLLTEYGRWVVPVLLELYDLHIDDEWDGLELITNVQQFHTSLRTRDLTDLTTPRVRSERLDDRRVRVTYDSDRKLCDVARGALYGVADRFDEELTVDEETCMHDGDDACRFVVERTATAIGRNEADARNAATDRSATDATDQGATRDAATGSAVEVDR
ncbi:heme NO-binding domain-containing protein [Natrarchaeobius oligotrophus]|uniref:Heme NO-binding protein n=1 Tax=Natrarchaeobius chitinivorans TaxID=1679083 RepID=A0A3N6MZD7_NATCH|nr:heme NO-binding domain-containing protein [Natrarchaeobius chitinivorans]RQH01892.1 heme NO-binding protein [Natrarchaeobius chitinivorans]